MSAPKSYLPLLSGLMLGDAISDHNGVRCYPAIGHSDQEKHIVKVISVPASQVQMDALLLTGAFPSREAAVEYYMDIAQDIIREAQILRELSHQEGFLPYIDGQIIPNDSFDGYEVYLLSKFRKSLADVFAFDSLTHKDIITIALDLCAALAACRREGYLYMDLKPGNIFSTEQQHYCIGDVGFASISSLAYSSLPEKYRSPYTPPELLDEMAVLNLTVDVYALGMILYQAYNGGVLPQVDAGQPMPAPLYADYEFGDIIAKACHADPAKRWKDPSELAQAILAYLQRNAVSDQPIIPVIDEPEEEPAEAEEFLPESDEESLRQEMAELEDAGFDNYTFLSSKSDDLSAELDENIDLSQLDESDMGIEEMLAHVDELIAHAVPEPPVAPAPIEIPMPEPITIDEPAEILLAMPVESEEALPEETLEVTEPEISQPVAEIEPSSPPAPEPAKAPKKQKPAKVPKEPKPKKEAKVPEKPKVIKEKPAQPKKAKKTVVRHYFDFPWKTVTSILLLVILVAACIGGYYFYKNEYIQQVDQIILEQKGDTLSVKVISDVEDGLLTVVCHDSYGNTMRQSVAAGIALFTGLDPQTHYTIRVEISGFHKLVGTLTDSFTTAAQTQITELFAGAGYSDGSVLIRFRTAGPAADSWTIFYSAPGSEEQSLAFQGNEVELTDLVIGSEYTFRLARTDGEKISGQTQVQHTPSSLLKAANLEVTYCGNGMLTLWWDTPATQTPILWTVHCYNSAGYSQVITTTDLSATFTGLTHDTPCSVDIIAEGMPVGVSTLVAANPISIESFDIRLNDETGMLEVTWNYFSNSTEIAWVLEWSIDEMTMPSMELSDNFAELIHIPGGVYNITVRAVGNSNQFGGSCMYDCPPVDDFSDLGISSEQIQGSLCICPEAENWTAADVAEDAYSSEFIMGQKIGIVITSETDPEASEDPVIILMVLRNANHEVVGFKEIDLNWQEMWIESAWAMELPFAIEDSGEYTVYIYCNGKYMEEVTFSITEDQ